MPVPTFAERIEEKTLVKSVATLKSAGAKVLAGGATGGGKGFCHANTLLVVDGKQFLAAPETMQTEAFGNSSLFVIADDIAQATKVLDAQTKWQSISDTAKDFTQHSLVSYNSSEFGASLVSS